MNVLYPGWTVTSSRSQRGILPFLFKWGFLGGQGRREKPPNNSVLPHTAGRFMCCGLLCPRGCPSLGSWSRPVAFELHVPLCDRPGERALLLTEAPDLWASQELHCRMVCPSAKLLWARLVLAWLLELSEVTSAQGHNDEQDPQVQACSITVLYTQAEALTLY